MKIIKRSFFDNSDFPEYSVLDANPQTHEEAIDAIKVDIIEEAFPDDTFDPDYDYFDDVFDPDYDYYYQELQDSDVVFFDDRENNNTFEYFITD